MQPTIGDHLARIRRQSTLTQEQLAERAEVSVETVRKLERNERTSARMSTLNRLARALRVPTSALLGSAARAAAEREPTALPLGLVEVRRALTPVHTLDGKLITAGPEVEPPTVADVDQAVRTANRIYHANDYAGTLTALPGLLAETRALVEVTSEDDQLSALALNALAHHLAGRLLLQLRQPDLAHAALTTAMDAANRSGNRLVGAAVVQPMSWLLLRQGRFTEAERLAVTTADQIEPRLSQARPEELAAWGWMLITASSAAARDGRDNDASEMLDLAAAAAHRVDDLRTVDRLADGYCSAKVQMMRVEATAIAGDPARTLDLSEEIQPVEAVTPSCWQRWRLDVAWSYTQKGRYTEAVGVLTELRDRAPTWLRHQRYARDIVTAIATERRRAMSQELAELTQLVGCTL